MDSEKFRIILKQVAEYKIKPGTAKTPTPKKGRKEESYTWQMKPKRSKCSDCDLKVMDRRCDFYVKNWGRINSQWIKKCLNCKKKMPLK